MASSTVLGKRKRKQVSYIEPNLNEYDDEEEGVQEQDEVSDDDATYSTRKALCTSRRISKKRARLTAPRPKMELPQKPFPFLSLPAELRDYIYELALTEADGITLVSATKALRRTVCRGVITNDRSCYRDGVTHGGEDPIPEHENSLSPALLSVNKQIHAEGVAWLYQQPLILEDTMALHTFLAAIGPANRQIVTEVVVKGWGRGRGIHKAMNVAALTSAADCTNLNTFRLDCDVARYRSSKDIAKQLYRDGHYFFERLGAANGRKDAIVDVLQLSDGNFDRSGYYGWQTNAPVADVEERKEAFRTALSKLLGC